MSTREPLKLYVAQSARNEKQDEQQVKAEKTMLISKMDTRMGPDDTSSDPNMLTRKNSVLPVLLRLSKLLLPEPIMADLHGAPENQSMTQVVLIFCTSINSCNRSSTYRRFASAKNNLAGTITIRDQA